MRRVARTLLVLCGLQTLLLAGYLLVEARRGEDTPFLAEPLDEPAPWLAVARADEPLPAPDGPHLVHFWATWCGPCRVELPGLVAAADAEGVPLLAVTDEPWPLIEAWFAGPVPVTVVRDPSGGAAARWRVSGLPETFVVAEGRLVARMGGARDWSSPAARRFLREVRP